MIRFDVTAPASHRGYVSFMSVQPGMHWIKRKRFTTDTLIRPETVSGPIRPDQLSTSMSVMSSDGTPVRCRHSAASATTSCWSPSPPEITTLPRIRALKAAYAEVFARLADHAPVITIDTTAAEA